MTAKMGWIWIALGGLAAGYLALLGVLFFAQRQLMYHPNAALADAALYAMPNTSMVELESDDGEKLNAWFAPASDAMPYMLYLHGNADHLGMRAEKLRHFIEAGYGVLAVSYRGYGGSSGKPSEEGLYRDARAGLAYLKEKGLQPHELVYYGESLGSGVAVQLATEAPPRALVLEAPYTAVSDRAQELYWYVPVRYLVQDRYESIKKMGKITAPVLVFHGELDTTMPIHHGRALFAAANAPKKAYFLPNVSHTDFPEPFLVEKLGLFLQHEAAR